MLTSLEICAGAGGQALGLEEAGFEHTALVEIEPAACQTLFSNRPDWNVINTDLKQFSAKAFKGIDLLAGGVPCPPFSVAGKQLGSNDERDLFPDAIRIATETKPKAILLENVKGIFNPCFKEYRRSVIHELSLAGYSVIDWKLINACDYGVSQLRPRSILIAFRKDIDLNFYWPSPDKEAAKNVGELLFDLMNEHNWEGSYDWKLKANRIAPTLVGGSKKHGGPDLGPSRAKKAWAELGVNGNGIADSAPARDFIGMPKLTARMAARIQGFPDSWEFTEKRLLLIVKLEMPFRHQ